MVLNYFFYPRKLTKWLENCLSKQSLKLELSRLAPGCFKSILGLSLTVQCTCRDRAANSMRIRESILATILVTYRYENLNFCHWIMHKISQCLLHLILANGKEFAPLRQVLITIWQPNAGSVLGSATSIF